MKMIFLKNLKERKEISLFDEIEKMTVERKN